MKLYIFILLSIVAIVAQAQEQDSVSAKHWNQYEYCTVKKETKKTSSADSVSKWRDYVVIFGIGGGLGYTKPAKTNHLTFDLDIICMNFLFSVRVGTLPSTSYCSFEDAFGIQLGALIPLAHFGGKYNNYGVIMKHKTHICISPILGFVFSQENICDGHFKHSGSSSIPYHNCRLWVDETKAVNHNCTEYGGALMLRNGNWYMLGKLTNKSATASFGFCF